jgi:hypothetical protein
MPALLALGRKTPAHGTQIYRVVLLRPLCL